MKLELESGLVVDDPTIYDLWNKVKVETFAVLSIDEMTYIQCAWMNCLDNDESEEVPRERRRTRAPRVRRYPVREYILEYQDGSIDQHFRATDEALTLESVWDAFCKYLRGDESWRSDFQWEQHNLAIPSKTTRSKRARAKLKRPKPKGRPAAGRVKRPGRKKK